MSLPSVLVLAVVALLGSAARAQPSPTREPRQRTVTVSGNPAEAPQPLHVAQGVTTVLLFKSLINELGGRGWGGAGRARRCDDLSPGKGPVPQRRFPCP